LRFKGDISIRTKSGSKLPHSKERSGV